MKSQTLPQSIQEFRRLARLDEGLLTEAKKSKTPLWDKLTPEQQKEAKGAMWSTFEAIASDLLDLAGGKISRRDAIETTLDADRVFEYGGIKDPEVKKFFETADWKELEAVGKMVFTASSYS